MSIPRARLWGLLISFLYRSVIPIQNSRMRLCKTQIIYQIKETQMSKMPVNPPSWRNDTVLPLPNEVKANAWAVDAACSGNPGPMEYQCIDLQTGAQVFHYGPIHGTNNIGEFLAIVHALALLTAQGSRMAVYSDSRNALLWVRACLLYTSPSPRDRQKSRMPSSA